MREREKHNIDRISVATDSIYPLLTGLLLGGFNFDSSYRVATKIIGVTASLAPIWRASGVQKRSSMSDLGNIKRFVELVSTVSRNIAALFDVDLRRTGTTVAVFVGRTWRSRFARGRSPSDVNAPVAALRDETRRDIRWKGVSR